MAETGQRTWRIVHSEASLGWGGQERRIMAELLGFRGRGCTVGLIAPKRSRIFQEAQKAGIECCELMEAKWAFPFAVLKCALWLRKFRAEIVNPHSSRDGWIVGLAARLARVRLLIRSRHFDVPIPNLTVSRHAYTTLADHVITTSPKVAEDFKKLFGLPPERITAISTGVDLREFSPEGPKAAVEFPANVTGPVIGIIGVLRMAKGHAVLFDAIKLLGAQNFPVRCVVVGEGPHWDNWHAKVKELGIAERVWFTGHRDDVPALLRAVDVLAMPSLHEAIPQVGLQALATKAPVVASDVGGIPFIIRAGETGRLVPSNDAAALAAALREALTDTARTRTMCDAGRALVEREHSVEAMLNRVEKIYRENI